MVTLLLGVTALQCLVLYKLYAVQIHVVFKYLGHQHILLVQNIRGIYVDYSWERLRYPFVGFALF